MKKDFSTLRLIGRFARLALAYRKPWLGVIAGGLIAAVLALVNPYISKLVIDEAIGRRDITRFIILIALAGGVYLVGELVGRWTEFLYDYIKVRVQFDLTKRVFRKIQRLDYRWFQDRSTGQNLYQFEFDVSAVTDLVANLLPHSVLIPFRFILILGTVFVLHSRMALLMLCLAPLLYIPSYWVTRWLKPMYVQLVGSGEEIMVRMQEIFSQFPLIKIFGKETKTTRGFLKDLMVNLRLNVRQARFDKASGFFVEILSKVVMVIVIFYGVSQVIRGSLSLGTLAALLVYVSQLSGLQAQMAGLVQTGMLSSFSCERIAAILDEKTSATDAMPESHFEIRSGSLVFDRVVFGYRLEHPVLKNISFEVPAGAFIALVGPSGCGKTTLLNLVLRLFELWEGDILVDGVSVRRVATESLRTQFGVVLQEPFLWNTSIRHNILYGNENAAPEAFLRAARLCGVDEFVTTLEKGYDTMIGEHASKISEGQKQKISIARAVIKEPKILICDEAFSHMDSLSEQKILSRIRQAYPKMTLIVVSHRLATALGAQATVYLKSADTVVQGSAKELLTRDKDFAALFGGQVSG